MNDLWIKCSLLLLMQCRLLAVYVYCTCKGEILTVFAAISTSIQAQLPILSVINNTNNEGYEKVAQTVPH